MAKPGRNDPCPCGSGNKYKKCCLAKEEALVREQLAKAEARRAERAAETAAAYRLHLREVKAAIAASLSGAEDAVEDELTIASNAAAELVRAGKLDEAEQAARDLLVLFPTCTMATIASAWSMRPVATTKRQPTATER
jgi:TolA-binding protein